jgi:exonuclease III
MDLRAQIDPNTVIVGDLNITLSPIDRSSRQKIIKETSKLIHMLAQMDKINICRVLHPTTMQYTFFSAAHETFSKICHILGTQQLSTNLRKFII